MKKILKPIVVLVLALLARAVLRRYRPRIVMVTGSVGKTSAKDAVAAALAARFFVRKSKGNLNTEFGVPFTILDVGDPFKDPLAWLAVVRSALALLLLPNHYPNLLVLEVGADRPGDLAKILRIATPDAVVVTKLPEIPVHVEAYASPEAVREEEFSPAYALSPGAPLIMSADDPFAREMAMRTSARLVSFGLSNDASVRLSGVSFFEERGTVAGMQATVNTGSEQGTCVVHGSVGKTQILPIAAAIAAAQAFDIALPDALRALDSYTAPAGRGRLLAGKNGATLIDDSYNASPVAVEEALATLKAFPRAGRRIAVLGDMLELGRFSVTEHERIAALASASADIIVTVGIRARAFGSSPGSAEVIQFDTARHAATALAGIVREGDVVLVKGSQSIRTERVVAALLFDPADASKLVRQERKWKEKV